MKKSLFSALFFIFISTVPDKAQPHRLIGFGCGEERLTLTRVEEDEFPPCFEIVAIAEACPNGESASECAAYWGHGY